MTFENISPRQKNRAALLRDVRSICTETCHLLGLDITKPSTDVITELVYKKILLYGSDLEAFARHAKRSTISTDDVKLLVRRNPSLKEHLGSISSNTAVKKQRRKTTNKPEKAVEAPRENELGTEKPVETQRKIFDNEVTSKVDDVEMETDHLEVFTNNPTTESRKTNTGTEIAVETHKLEETIDLTFD
ncbi:centromere protein S-like isoform X2 [Aricia agestis]|uniref:centromere protein S-like isoform X1 n=1 Tax=Aricia agestis TaxID=91739 RepID=UPI001C207072|nr:centromere protein S-like isoform X1 [Aricia agestis]XP_041979321.1 centromere protein S-like isoform X2 [Aricia agestis]